MLTLGIVFTDIRPDMKIVSVVYEYVGRRHENLFLSR